MGNTGATESRVIDAADAENAGAMCALWSFRESIDDRLMSFSTLHVAHPWFMSIVPCQDEHCWSFLLPFMFWLSLGSYFGLCMMLDVEKKTSTK